MVWQIFRKSIKGSVFSTMSRKSEKCWRFYSMVFSAPKISKQTERWDAAVQEASELLNVQTKTPFNVQDNYFTANNLNKIMTQLFSSHHPVVDAIRQLMYDTRLNCQLHCIVALLFAKALGHTANSPNYDEAIQTKGITLNQRRLADALELSRAGFIIHSSAMNLTADVSNKNLAKANGLSVLLGDFLASHAFLQQALIRDNKVNCIMTQGSIKKTESGFCNEVDKQGNALPCHSSPLSVWREKNIHHANLLTKGCQSIAHLGGHGEDVQKAASECVQNLAMALKFNTDLEHFKEIFDCKPGKPFSLELAPVIMHLDTDPDLVQYIRENAKDDISNLDFVKLFEKVNTGNGEERAIATMEEHISEGEKLMNLLGNDESRAKQLIMIMFDSLRPE